MIGTSVGEYRSPNSGKGEFMEEFSVIMDKLLELSPKDCTTHWRRLQH